MATSETQICNIALQKLGAKRISSLSDDTKSGRACNARYATVRDMEFRRHPWNFTLKRVTLAPDVNTPEFGFNYQFTLPSDFLRLHPDSNYQEETDWQIEGRKLLTNDGTVLYLRYVARVTDVNYFDDLFVEAFASRLAFELCEELTQSNTKQQLAAASYQDAIAEAKRVDAIEKVSQKPPEDEWLTAML